MISNYAISEALKTKLAGIATANSYTVELGGKVNGLPHKPAPTDTYISGQMLFNTTSTMGLAGDSGDITRPIFQVNVYTPKQDDEWPAFTIAEVIIAAFPKAEFIVNDTHFKVQTQTVSASSYIPQEVHGMVVISVNLTVVATTA